MVSTFYASITDYKGNEVCNLQFTVTAKHAAWLAQQFVKSCPPAHGFNIHKRVVDAKQLVHLLNEKGL